ncbi:prepilin-type N-terminal cleavage/methylation domain-containing protein [Candidatus Gottesmanbacteria bacterium]|nr:prepilin-type N-terminal cleavage/methylation domain-containing protein [Candidatus Gottesmanbacteria bacterium]
MANIRIIHHNGGFSLMELLIVIAIIGALVSIAAASYSSAQKRSRDSRRSSDIKAMQNAWEQYYSDQGGVYPTLCTASMTSYLPQGLPLDPKTSANYYANAATSCTPSTYCFCALLERTGGGNASDTSCTYAAGGNYSCLSNLQ